MQKPNGKPHPSLSVRIDIDAGGRIGPGKIELLETIHRSGSISAAGRAMEMSYKRAWDLVDEINRICRQAAVERQTGGKNGGGAVLTPFGLSLVLNQLPDIAIIEGLKAGETVVSTGVFKLRNGMLVTISNDLAPKPQLNPTPADS